MDFVNLTPFPFAPLPGKVRPPAPSLTIVVKGTFTLVPDGKARPADTQALPIGDVHKDDDPEKLLLYSSDYAYFKPAADLLAQGTCYAPGGKPTVACPVEFRLGAWSKRIAVIGDRFAKGVANSPPASFVTMEISYENTFGGPKFAQNPIGKGHSEETLPDGSRGRRVQNLEYAGNLQFDTSGKVDPASFGPLPMTWKQRMMRAGTYGGRWQKERWPWFPEDFDWSFYNAAPKDQQLKGYLRGDEELFFENLHAKFPRYKSRLPGLRVRVFLQEALRGKTNFREVTTNLDTLWAKPDADELVLVWRGTADVQSEKAAEIRHVLLVSEPTGEAAKGREYYQAVLAAELAKRLVEENIEFASPPPTPPPPPAPPAPAPPEVAPPDPAMTEVEAKIAELEKLLPKAPAVSPGPAPSLEDLPKLEADLRRLLEARGIKVAEPEPPSPPIEEPRAPETAAPPPPPSIRERAERRESFSGEDLSDADLSNLDLSGMGFQGTVLARANLAGSRLAKADLSKSNLMEANLSGADLAEAILADADLTEANLEGAKLTGALLEGALLASANLRRADLSSVRAKGADLTFAALQGANLQGAILEEASLEGCGVEGANFSRALLSSAALNRCWGKGANFSEAELGKARLNDAVLTQANFAKAKGAGSIWEQAALHRSRFTNADLESAELSSAYLEGASFLGANLKHARLCEAVLRGTEMAGVNLFQGTLEKADLTAADFRQSNLYEVELLDAVTVNTNFTQANVKMTKRA